VQIYKNISKRESICPQKAMHNDNICMKTASIKIVILEI